MISDSVMEKWYIPIEISTLKRWLIVSTVVNIFLLGVDILRGDILNLTLGFNGCISLIVLYCIIWFIPNTKLPRLRRDQALFMSGIVTIIGLLQLLNSELRLFDFWMRSWMIFTGLLSIIWVSGKPVTVWTRGGLSKSALEYGLERNNNLKGKYQSFGTHLVLIHFVFITLLPLIWIFDIALSPGNALGGTIGDSFTGEHFEKILSSDSFWTWMRNSLIVSIGTSLLGLSIAIPAGYAFSRYKFTGRDVSMFSFLLVQMFPGIIILVPYFLVMKSLGLLNTHLGLILAYCVTALPLCVWMLKGFFDTVPRELEEAAILDGCTQFQVFTKVVLPLSLPAIAVTALFSFLAAWNEFLLALTFNTSNDMYTLPVGLASMISSTGQAWGDFAAASLLVSLPVALLFLFFQKFLIEGLSAGGVKG